MISGEKDDGVMISVPIIVRYQEDPCNVIRDVLDKKSKWHTMQNGYQGQTSLNE